VFAMYQYILKPLALLSVAITIFLTLHFATPCPNSTLPYTIPLTSEPAPLLRPIFSWIIPAFLSLPCGTMIMKALYLDRSIGLKSAGEVRFEEEKRGEKASPLPHLGLSISSSPPLDPPYYTTAIITYILAHMLLISLLFLSPRLIPKLSLDAEQYAFWSFTLFVEPLVLSVLLGRAWWRRERKEVWGGA